VRSTIRVGDPSAKVLAYADEVRANLIVMATHGRNAFAQMLLGSVTQAVLRKAPCPVLTLSPSACRWEKLFVPGSGEAQPGSGAARPASQFVARRIRALRPRGYFAGVRPNFSMR